MFRRSKHIAISVQPGRYDAAVDYYLRAFGMELEDKTPSVASLKGPNFMIYIEARESLVPILQEWVPASGSNHEAHLLALGCKLIEVDGCSHSGEGFYVEDPFGLCYHVYTAEGLLD